MFRESIAYAEACAPLDENELLDEIVADQARVGPHEIPPGRRAQGQRTPAFHDTVALLESKATTAELAGYRHFVLASRTRSRAVHRKGGQSVTPAEAEATQRIAAALATTGS